MSCIVLFTLYGRQQGRDEPLRHDLELGHPGHYDDAGDARRKRTGFIMFLIQVENYFVIHSPEFFFLRFFAQWELHRSIGGSLWELCISSTSFLLLIGIIFSSLQFSRIKGGWRQLNCLDVYSLDSITQCRASGSVGKCIFALASLTPSELREIR